MSSLEIIRQAREQQDPILLTGALPYAKALGITLSSKEDELIGTMAFGQPIIGDLGVATLHSGAISALLESTSILTLLWEIEDMKIPETINSTFEFLLAGRPLPTHATAQITRHGKDVANIQCTAWQKDRKEPIAVSYSHYLLVSGSA